MSFTTSIPTTPERRTNNSLPPNIKKMWKQSKEDNDKIMAFWVRKASIKSEIRDALKENWSDSLNLCRSEDRLGCGDKFNTPPGLSLLGKRKAKSMPGHRTQKRRNDDVTCVKKLKF